MINDPDLLKTYIALNDQVTSAEAELERLKIERSALVKSIHDQIGKGPHNIEGKAMFIFSRGDTWFFSLPRGKSK